MTNVSRLGLASVILLLAGCATQSSAPPPAAPAPAAPAPAAPAPAAPAPAAPAPSAAAPAPAAGDMVAGLPPGPNRDLTIRVCSSCHDTSSFSGQRHGRDEWQGIVASMNTGASAEDEQKVVDYLATALAPGR